MPKNLFQDMVKVKREKENRVPYVVKREEVKREEVKIRREDIKPKIININGNDNVGGKSRHGLYFVSFISLVFFLFALSFIFTRAEVEINPKTQNVTLNKNLSAIKDSNVDGLAFDLVVIPGEETQDIPAGEQKDVALQAKGTILMFNSFSSASQKLLIDTKLEGSNGKIYKTSAPITIPGVDEDGNPGRVEVGIYATEAGEEYNSAPLDFKILNFKGTPKYTKFNGRSKAGTEITGGFKGKSPFVSEAEKENTISKLKTSLETKLFNKATEQLPDGFVLFKDAVALKVDEEKIGFSSRGNTLPITIKGRLYGVLFEEKSLTKKIAEDAIAGYDGSEVFIPNIREFVFLLPSKEVLLADAQNINFNLSGEAQIVWKFDESVLISALARKPKKEFNQILSEYPNVESAELSLSPFWVRSFPSKAKNIKVIVNYPK